MCQKTKFPNVKIAYLIPALTNNSINITSDPDRVGRLLKYKKNPRYIIVFISNN